MEDGVRPQHKEKEKRFYEGDYNTMADKKLETMERVYGNFKRNLYDRYEIGDDLAANIAECTSGDETNYAALTGIYRSLIRKIGFEIAWAEKHPERVTAEELVSNIKDVFGWGYLIPEEEDHA